MILRTSSDLISGAELESQNQKFKAYPFDMSSKPWHLGIPLPFPKEECFNLSI